MDPLSKESYGNIFEPEALDTLGNRLGLLVLQGTVFKQCNTPLPANAIMQ